MTSIIPDDESRLAWLDGNPIIVGRCRLDLYDGGVLVVVDAPNRLLHITEPLAASMEIHLAPVADKMFSAGRWQEAADDEFPISILSVPVVSWLSDEGVVTYGVGKVEVNPRMAGEVFDEGLAGVYEGMEKVVGG
ncbi:hypothetical protein [Methanocalculus sp. MC3]